MFLAKLEDDVADGAPTLTCHIDLHAWDFFIKYNHEPILARAVNFLLRSPTWILDAS
jgi:hypothetical protein